MANVEKVSVALTPELAAALRQVIDAGEYASASDVMREALREWTLRRLHCEQVIQELGCLWDIGLESGSPLDGEEVFSRIIAGLDEKFPAQQAP